MSDIHPNPFGRKFNRAEIAAARRLGIEVPGRTDKTIGGPLIYASDTRLDWWPQELRKEAEDRLIVAAAIEREFTKPLRAQDSQ